MADETNEGEGELADEPLAESDWRLTGQERSLAGAEWVRKRYHAASEAWEHDHCEFCWAKLMDPDFSPEHRRFIAEHPEVRTEGYATTAAHPDGADSHWVCEACFSDLAGRFGWRLVAENG
jgi:hypothetical protein